MSEPNLKMVPAANCEVCPSSVAREIANVLLQRAIDGFATTIEELVAMGQWPRAVIERELPAAEDIARQGALNIGVV